MAEALYRKYRPLTFEQVVGQKSIVKTLKNALSLGKLSHAYLLYGTRGTGKTTIARILGKALLCEKAPTDKPCGQCVFCQEIAKGVHTDVYELDAASRTGVDNVREEIISRVNYAPTQGKFKIYIIDEVHMLSTAAFNSLLKTLEEPPKHVIFILCTTEPHKIPATILSRCQRFDFKPITLSDIKKRLEEVCINEKISIDEKSLQMLAKTANGAMRNALTELEQAIAFCGNKITIEQLSQLKGATKSSSMDKIIKALSEKNVSTCIIALSEIIEQGHNLNQFAKNLIQRLRNIYIVKSLRENNVDMEKLEIEEYMEKELLLQSDMFNGELLLDTITACEKLIYDLKTSNNIRLSIEIFFIKLCGVTKTTTQTISSARTQETTAHTATQIAKDNQAEYLPTVSANLDTMPPTTTDEEITISNKTVSNNNTAEQASTPQKQQAIDKTINSIPDEFINAIKPQKEKLATSKEKKSLSDFEQTKMDITKQDVLDQIWHKAMQTLIEKDPPRAIIFKHVDRVFFDPAKQEAVLEFAANQDFSYKQSLKGLYRATIQKAMFLAANGSFKFNIIISEKISEPEKPQKENIPVPQFIENINPASTVEFAPVAKSETKVVSSHKSSDLKTSVESVNSTKNLANESVKTDKELEKFAEDMSIFGDNVKVSELKPNNIEF